MSIVTKTGDRGTTVLMYNRRVPKCHPRVEACGAVDELNAAIGLARATAEQDFARKHLSAVQQDLVLLMGELATAAEDLPRYVKDGYALVTPSPTARVEELIREIEAANVIFKGWAIPGASVPAAALDVARTVCRRAERRLCGLQAGGQLHNAEMIVYLNRLSDLLWLLARWSEAHRLGREGGGGVDGAGHSRRGTRARKQGHGHPQSVPGPHRTV
jgi:cob(I)alamin adenosyltransferase